MIRSKRFWVFPACLILLLIFIVGCSPNVAPPQDDIIGEAKDYAGLVSLDMSSSTAKLEVSVKTYIDGDTTHFYTDSPAFENGVIKARYLAINTPESTGKIEEYGKAASQFTREKLSEATSIIVESENGTWNPDSTGSRYLVWVWYKTADSESYRNLNIEILQNGLALPNSEFTESLPLRQTVRQRSRSSIYIQVRRILIFTTARQSSLP